VTQLHLTSPNCRCTPVFAKTKEQGESTMKLFLFYFALAFFGSNLTLSLQGRASECPKACECLGMSCVSPRGVDCSACGSGDPSLPADPWIGIQPGGGGSTSGGGGDGWTPPRNHASDCGSVRHGLEGPGSIPKTIRDLMPGPLDNMKTTVCYACVAGMRAIGLINDNQVLDGQDCCDSASACIASD
jgi:hypothetical protein